MTPKLWAYHKQLYFGFFNLVEDRAWEICRELMLLRHEVQDGTPKSKLKARYSELTKRVNEMNEDAEEQMAFLAKEGVPRELTRPVFNHAKKRVEKAAQRYLDATKEVRDD